MQAQFNASKSTFIPLGKSLGIVCHDENARESGAGAMVGLDVADLSGHMMVSGGPGSGKSSLVLQPLVRSWISAGNGGVLVMDPGKSELPYDLEGVLDKVLTPENSNINLIDGLSPDLVVGAISHALKESGPLEASAEKDIQQATYVLDYASRFPNMKAVAPYCIKSIYNFCLFPDFREAVLKLLPPPDGGHMKASFDYWLVQVPSSLAETRAATEFTVRELMSSLFLYSELGKWIGDESDLNIAEYVSKGGRIGVAASEDKYGAAGKMAMALIRAALYGRMESRGADWSNKEGERPVLLVVDECAVGITATDMSFVRTANSCGCTMLFSSWDCESLKLDIARHVQDPEVTEDCTKAFLNAFSSTVTLSSTMDAVRHECERVGTLFRRCSDESSEDIRDPGAFEKTVKSIIDLFFRGKGLFPASAPQRNAKKVMPQLEVIKPEEVSLYLQRPFTALVNLKCGDGSVCDIVDLSMWHPKNLAKQQVQKIAA